MKTLLLILSLLIITSCATNVAEKETQAERQAARLQRHEKLLEARRLAKQRN